MLAAVPSHKAKAMLIKMVPQPVFPFVDERRQYCTFKIVIQIFLAFVHLQRQMLFKILFQTLFQFSYLGNVIGHNKVKCICL